DGDGILFYGRALDTPSTGTHIYWLVTDQGSGARIATPPAADAPATTRRSFMATVERRDRLYYLAVLRGSDNFVGAVVSTDAANPTKQTLTLRHVDHQSLPASVSITLQGATDGEHRVAVSLNGHPLGEIVFNGMERT